MPLIYVVVCDQGSHLQKSLIKEELVVRSYRQPKRDCLGNRKYLFLAKDQYTDPWQGDFCAKKCTAWLYGAVFSPHSTLQRLAMHCQQLMKQSMNDKQAT